MAKISFFGRLQDITGHREDLFDLPASVATTIALREFLSAKYNAGTSFLDTTVRIAINNEFAHEPANITNDDDIAFMPPVGGG